MDNNFSSNYCNATKYNNRVIKSKYRNECVYLDFIQLIVSGLANGCVYGLIALGFVLIYKATEAVNFAQGDFMMIGAFICLGLTNAEYMGLSFWLAIPLTMLIMGVLGYAFDWGVLRHMSGQSQVSIVILTIALGFVAWQMSVLAGQEVAYKTSTIVVRIPTGPVWWVAAIIVWISVPMQAIVTLHIASGKHRKAPQEDAL